MKRRSSAPIGYTHHIKNTTVGPEVIFNIGNGPNVILLPESPGAHQGVFTLGRELAKAGFKIHIMILFGEVNQRYSHLKAAKFVAKACLSKEFTMLSKGRSSPMTSRVRAYGKYLYDQTKKPIGIIGMCITGNFALACLAEPWMLAPVLSQPSLPIPFTPNKAGSLNTPNEIIAAGVKRCDVELLGLRFSHDPMCPKQRFNTLKRLFKEKFIEIEIDSSPGNPHKNPKSAHSVLTVHRVMKANHPTDRALNEVKSFLKRKLGNVE